MNQETMNRISDLEDMLKSMWNKEDYNEARSDCYRELEGIMEHCDHKFPDGTSAWSHDLELESCEICATERSRS